MKIRLCDICEGNLGTGHQLKLRKLYPPTWWSKDVCDDCWRNVIQPIFDNNITPRSDARIKIKLTKAGKSQGVD